MKRCDRILSSLLLLGAAVTIAYWVNYVVAATFASLLDPHLPKWRIV